MGVVLRTVNSRRSAFVRETRRSCSSMSLHGVRVFIEAAAVDDFAVLGYRAHRPIGRQHRAGGIEQRTVKEFGGAERADVAQVGSDARAFSVDGMATRAVARAREQRLAASRVADIMPRASKLLMLRR